MNAHVLIVDDEDGPRQALEYALRRKNRWWTLSTASSLDEARRILSSPPEDRGPVDVVLTDDVLGAERNGGIAVLEAAKRIDPFTMVILFTAENRELDRFEAYRHGAFDCIEKDLIGQSAWREISIKASAAIDFRRLALSQLAAQKRVTALERFFDPRLLQAVENDPSALAVRQRTASIVFFDIRGFSALCHGLETRPDVLQGFLFDYYSMATQIVFRHAGVLDKLMGDTVMALFCDLGARGPGEHDPVAAVEAAVRMRDSFDALRRKWQVQWRDVLALDLHLAASVHTGDCLVGNLGTARREQFTAVGTHVNLATQLRRCAAGGQVLLSETTAAGLGEGWRLDEAGRIDDPPSRPGSSVRLFEVAARPKRTDARHV
ncbi:MAG: adenylate/guanylate cyclase domain-containing protein [Acidobacteriota bacterium]